MLELKFKLSPFGLFTHYLPEFYIDLTFDFIVKPDLSKLPTTVMLRSWYQMGFRRYYFTTNAVMPKYVSFQKLKL